MALIQRNGNGTSALKNWFLGFLLALPAITALITVGIAYGKILENCNITKKLETHIITLDTWKEENRERIIRLEVKVDNMGTVIDKIYKVVK